MVVWSGRSIRPIAIVVGDEDRSELFAWMRSFHRDLVPLTSWCHVLSPSELKQYAGSWVDGSLSGFEAAWSSSRTQCADRESR